MASLNTTTMPTTQAARTDFGVPSGLWRSGNLLVVKRGAVLPERCLKTNQLVPGARKKITLYWHSPWIFALVLVNVLIFLIVSFAARKSVVLEITMSPEMIRRRNRGYLIGGAIGLGGIIELAVGGMQREPDGFHLLIGIVGLLVGIVVASAASQVLTIQKLEGEYAYLKGASPEYLVALPEWPGTQGALSWTD
jgi:hypothetical protein